MHLTIWKNIQKNNFENNVRKKKEKIEESVKKEKVVKNKES